MARPAKKKKPAESVKAEPVVLEQETPDTIEDAVVVEDQADIPTDKPQTPQAPVETPEKPRKSGFFAMLLGGVVAGGVGFGLAQVVGDDGVGTDQLNAAITAQQVKTTALEGKIATLTQAQGDATPKDVINGLLEGQDAAEKATADLTSGLGALGQRLTDIENRPLPEVGATADAVATYERELAAMREMFQQELTRIKAAQEQAIAAQGSVAQREGNVAGQAALTQIQTAIQNGGPFAGALGELAALGVEIPVVLTGLDDQGVATLSALQDAFPPLARAVLDGAARADAQAGKTSTFTAFLRTQFGARSLTPQGGDGPDAVLSRAEAALRNGDLDTVLAELETIPADISGPLSGWVNDVLTRQQAVDGVVSLQTALNR